MLARTAAGSTARFWRDPLAWLKHNNFSRGFWIYFAAALFFDAGFCIYFFIFNLYLLDLHFHERFIGLVSGAMTLGGVLVILPAGILASRIGVRRLLLLCYFIAPLIHALRAVCTSAPAQLVLAFLAGMALSIGGVCYLPIVARVTTEKNRTAGFSLILSASLASSAIGGLLCAWIPAWLQRSGTGMPAIELKRIILLASCAIALLAVIPAAHLGLVGPADDDISTPASRRHPLTWPRVSPALIRVLIPLTLWALVLAAFFPFGNVYLSTQLHLPLERISFMFSTAQIVQLSMLAATPILLGSMGRLNGILAIQTLTGITLGILACTRHPAAAVPLFLLFTALQWMANPGLYDLLMTSTPDGEREAASAMMLFLNGIVSALATPCAGALYTRFGYRVPMLAIGALAILVALLSRVLLAPRKGRLHDSRPARHGVAGAEAVGCPGASTRSATG